MAKINISIDDDLLSRIDDYSDKNYMSRSGLITLACTNFLNQNEVLLAIKDVSLSVRKIADTSSIDHESMEKLEDFERLCKMLVK